jgi:hypothetical protein
MWRASGFGSAEGETVRFLNWKRDLGAKLAVTVLSWSVRDLIVCKILMEVEEQYSS